MNIVLKFFDIMLNYFFLVELEQLMAQENVQFSNLFRSPIDYPWGRNTDHVLTGHIGSGSGGYAHHILVYAAKELFNMELTEMNWKATR